MTMSDEIITLRGVKKVFQTDEVETHALSDIHMEIRRGEYVAISGPSGCGKTTTLRLIAGFVEPGESLEDAVRLVRRRGDLMQETGVARPGTMAAVLGETSEPIDVLCARVSTEPGCLVVAANYNAPGQVVISGAKAALDLVPDIAKAKGIKRAIPLAVSAPFHCPLMRPAAEKMAEALAQVSIETFPDRAGHRRGMAMDGRVLSTISDDQGHFEVKGLKTGPYRVMGYRDELYQDTPMVVEAGARHHSAGASGGDRRRDDAVVFAA